jgi:hypothetical protein
VLRADGTVEQDFMGRISFDEYLDGPSTPADTTSNHRIWHGTGRPIGGELPHQDCTSIRRSIALDHTSITSQRTTT